MPGVGDKPVAGVIGQFGDLCLDMGALSSKGVKTIKVEMRQHIQHQDGCCALRVGRMFDQLCSLVIARYGGGIIRFF